MAHDKDKGNNGEVRYSLSIDSDDTANVFAIDAYTGWINTLIKLDKETKSEYKFYVIATDNGQPKHTTRTTVIVKLVDYNDSPPMFKNTVYQANVLENARPGSLVVKLSTSDADLDLITPIDYYIISGDSRNQFQIRDNGDVIVSKSLDRETINLYKLGIIATDGMFTARTQVAIEVLDVNGKYIFYKLNTSVKYDTTYDREELTMLGHVSFFGENCSLDEDIDKFVMLFKSSKG